MTWLETLSETCLLDSKYNLELHRMQLAASLPYLHTMCHSNEDPDGHVRILTKHTNAAAFLAFTKHADGLVPTWLTTYHPLMVAPLRSMLLARILEKSITSTLPDMVYLCSILARGLRECWACAGRGEALRRLLLMAKHTLRSTHAQPPSCSRNACRARSRTMSSARA